MKISLPYGSSDYQIDLPVNDCKLDILNPRQTPVTELVPDKKVEMALSPPL